MTEFHFAGPGPDHATAVAILLHPHPDMGGNRFHPLISELHRRLPDAGIGTVRFDFSSSDLEVARGEIAAAIDAVAKQWPNARVVLVGYSFGAAMAAGVVDERVTGWFLIAPAARVLAGSGLGTDPRPKVLVVPERDNFSPPDTVDEATDGWVDTERLTVPGDHFLGGSLDQIIEYVLNWFNTPI